jgi:HAD superfamily hydrolase (TIGR01450 family)
MTMSANHKAALDKILNDQIKLFAFDLDGTLYVGEKAVPEAIELIAELRRNHQVVYFTNNSSKTITQLSKKLRELGFFCGSSDVYSAGAATADYLKESGLDNVYLIGSVGLRAEVEARGLRVCPAKTAHHVVVGLDLDFTYQKIADALAIINRGGKFIACNEDRNFPAGEGLILPGCGAMAGAITTAADKTPDFTVGKPNPYLLARIATEYGVKAEAIMVVGDSYDSDIAMALSYRSKAILVGQQAVFAPTVWSVENVGQIRRLLRKSQ